MKLAGEIRGSEKKNFEKEKVENSQRVLSSLSNYCMSESMNIVSCLAKFLHATCASLSVMVTLHLSGTVNRH